VSKRPPFLGYNHNVRHAGHLFHVQTEDSGLGRLVLFTHCFVDGTILASLRGTYTAEESDAVVQKRMQDQHKAMLRRVRDGEFDNHPEVVARAGQAGAHDKPAATAAPGGEAAARPDTKPAAAIAKPEGKPEGKPESKLDARLDGKPDAGALAARLLQKTPAQPVQAPLIPAAAPVAVVPSPVVKPAASAPVIDLDADSDDDLMIDIVADSATDDEEEAFELSKATPLPAARPLVGGDSAEHAPVYPPSPNPLFQVTVGRVNERQARLTRPVYVRVLHTGRLRMHSTSEGAVMLTPASLKSPSGYGPGRSSEPLRKTLFHARPTIPGAVSAIGLGSPAPEPAPLDDIVMSFLRKEASRPL
jgi:hypothetical protein